MGFEAGQVVSPNTSGLFICTNISDECEGDITIGNPQTCTIENVLVEPPTPPTPQMASLTVNKTIFGCNNLLGSSGMDCSDLQNNDTRWISCDDLDDDPEFPPIFCGTALNKNSFDIEVVNASNNQQINQFEGSALGTTITNLQPGTYTVNEIEDPTGNSDNQLGDSQTSNSRCCRLRDFLMEEFS